MSKPFFSVVILAFNRPKLLKRALGSVLKQKFKNYEIIVIDGGKKYLSEQIVKNILKPIRYYKIIDRGIGLARDFGLRKAKGEWVAFLDDDDAYTSTHLQVRYNIIKQNNNLELIYNGFKTIGSPMVPDLLNHGKFLNVNNPQVFHAGTAVIKTKVAKKIEGFKKASHVNYPDDFYSVAKRAGLKIRRIINPKTYLYYRSSTSYTGQLAKKYKK